MIRRPPALAAPLAVVVLPFLLSAATAAEPTPETLPIVERAIEHHGGGLYEASETELAICSRSGCFDVLARVDGGEYLYRVAGETSEGRRVVESTNDAVRWWVDGDEREVTPGNEQRLRDWVMARVYFPFLPYRLADPGVFQEDQGIEPWDGRPLHRVKVTFAPGSSTEAEDEYLFWFDPESGRLEQFAYSFSGDPGGLRFRRAFDHRRVGGLLFSDQENLGVEGEGLAVDRITPDFVAERMRPISTVVLEGIEVRPLGEGGAEEG